MKPEDSKLVSLCRKQCLATEIATAIIYSGAIFLWMTILISPGGRTKAEPVHDQPAPGCTVSARTQQFTQALSL